MRLILSFFFIFFLECFDAIGTETLANRTQEDVDMKVETTALETYSRINERNNWSYPQRSAVNTNVNIVDIYDSTSLDHWDMGKRGILYKGRFFIEFHCSKRPDVSLSTALETLENACLECDCLFAVNFVSLKCLEALLGSENLNKLCDQWEKKYQRPYYLSTVSHDFLCTLFFNLDKTSSLEWRGRGGIVYIMNDPAYLSKIAKNHTFVDSAENLIQVGFNEQGPLYIGFTSETYPEPISAERVKQHLKMAFEEDAQSQGITLEWDEAAFIENNKQTGLYVRTFSADLINSYLNWPNLDGAETRTSSVLELFPMPTILSTSESKIFSFLNYSLEQLQTDE